MLFCHDVHIVVHGFCVVDMVVVSGILRVSGSSRHSPVTSQLQPAKQTRRRRWCSVVPPMAKLAFLED